MFAYAKYYMYLKYSKFCAVVPLPSCLDANVKHFWLVVANVQLVSVAYTHLCLLLFSEYLFLFCCGTIATRRLLSDFR